MSAQGRQKRVGALSGNDLFGDLRSQGLYIRLIGDLRVGHDSRGVRVDEDDGETRRPQRFTRLCTRIVELGGLPDNDGAASEDKDFFEVVAFGHRLKTITRIKMHGAL